MTGLLLPKPEPRCLRQAAIDREKAKAWRAVKARVRKRDSGRCRYCGRPCLADPHHILPRSLGGRDIDSNLVSLCRQHHDWCKPGLLRIKGDANEMGRLEMWVSPRVDGCGEHTVWR